MELQNHTDDQNDLSYQFYDVIDACLIADMLPVIVLSTLCKVSRRFYGLVARFLNRKKRIYNRMLPRVSEAVYRRLIGHPFSYDGIFSKVLSFDTTRVSLAGLNFTELAALPPNITKRQLALRNIVLFARQPEPLKMLLIVDNRIIMIQDYEVTDYETAGHLFMLDLKLITIRNPLPIQNFCDPNDICFSIGKPLQEQMYHTVAFSAVLTATLFTHVITSYYYTNSDAYQWDNHLLMLPECMEEVKKAKNFSMVL
jgi:hypothetical protein